MEQKQHCQPCKRCDNIVTPAVIWCSNCFEALCRTCADTHKRFKITELRRNIRETDFLNEQMSNSVFCSVHKDKPVETVCFDHGVICCVSCITKSHRKCMNVLCFDDMEEIKSENIENLRIYINNITQLARRMNDRILKNRISSGKSIKTFCKRAQAFAVEIKKKIDDACERANYIQNVLENDLDRASYELDKVSYVSESLYPNLKTTLEYGSKLKIFEKVTQLKQESLELEKRLRVILDNEVLISYYMGNAESFNMKNNLGEVKFVIQSMEIEKETYLGSLSRCYGMKPFLFESLNMKLKLERTLQMKGDKILDCVHLNPDILAVLYPRTVSLVNIRNGRSISVFNNPQFTMAKRICNDTYNSTLYVACHAGIVWRLPTNGYQFEDSWIRYNIGNFVSGITTFSGQIYVTSEKAILKISCFPERLKQVFHSIESSGKYYDKIVSDVHSADRLALTLNHSRVLCFVNIRSREIRPFRGDIGLFSSITFGPLGVLFVVDENCTIHIISKDGLNSCVCLLKPCHIEEVTNIWIDIKSYRLFVCGTDMIEVYKIET